MKMKQKRGVAYQKMVRSVLLAMIAPLVMTVAVYYYGSGIMERQAKEINSNLLDTIQNICDKEIVHYQNLISQFSWNDKIRTIGMEDEFGTKTQIQATKLLANLDELAASMDSFTDDCRDVFVYFPRVDRFLSSTALGTMDFYSYADIIVGLNEAETQWFQGELDGCYSSMIVGRTLEKSGAKRLLVMVPAARAAGRVNAVVGLWLDQGALLDTVQMRHRQENSDWLIIDAEYNVIKEPNTISVGETFDPESFPEKEHYVCSLTTSELTGMTYILLQPRSSVADYAKSIQMFFILGILVCMLVEFFLLRKTVQINYAPLEQLMNLFRRDEQEHNQIENEYAYLGRNITQMMEHQESLRQRIDLKDDALKKLFATNILLKPFSGDTENEELRQFASQFEGKQTLVVLLSQQGSGNVFRAEDIKALVGDMLADDAYTVELVEQEEQTVLLISGQDLTGAERKIHRALEEVQRLVSGELGISLDISLGEAHDGLPGIHLSYLEALETSEFLAVLERSMISYREIMDQTARCYNYTIDTEERIIRAIQSDNGKLAETLINRVLDVNFKNNHLDATLRRCLIIHIYCTLLRAADEKGMLQLVEVPATVFRSFHSAETMKKQYAVLLERLCPLGRETALPSAERELCGQVLEYVKENYADPDLNISGAAQHFHVSPSKLGALYKKETGKSLLNVISDIRMEAAMNLLQQGLSVNECARRVGFEDTTTFIRQFKKYMGKTPAQMRAELQNLESE